MYCRFFIRNAGVGRLSTTTQSRGTRHPNQSANSTNSFIFLSNRLHRGCMAPWARLPSLADVLSNRSGDDQPGCREPEPPLGTWIDVQVPPRTQLPPSHWRSTVALPLP